MEMNNSAYAVCPNCRKLFPVGKLEEQSIFNDMKSVMTDLFKGSDLSMMSEVIEETKLDTLHYSGTGICECGSRNMVSIFVTQAPL